MTSLLDFLGQILCFRDEIEEIGKKYSITTIGQNNFHVPDNAMPQINQLINKIITFYKEYLNTNGVKQISWVQKGSITSFYSPVNTNIIDAKFSDYTYVEPHGGSIGQQQLWEMSNAGLNYRRFYAIKRIVSEVPSIIKQTQDLIKQEKEKEEHEANEKIKLENSKKVARQKELARRQKDKEEKYECEILKEMERQKIQEEATRRLLKLKQTNK